MTPGNPLQDIRRELRSLGDREKSQTLQRFFKTGPGEYGEGDVFLGVRVPQLRKLARVYKDLPERALTGLLSSRYHEERHVALLILVRAFAGGDESSRKRIYDLYVTHIEFINNWDLVDTSAEHIVGAYLAQRSRRPLYELARSPIVWRRRIAIMATFHYVKRYEFADTIKIARLLLDDHEDLIHKAAGWMLREVGKRDLSAEEKFLRDHYREMPRIMLRYAIERFPEPRRQAYLKGTIE
jgi:3-methyladenine DNA glycosylase AlkD